MLWFWAALSVAMLWGFSYAAVEHILKQGMSSMTLLALYGWLSMPIFTFLAWRSGELGWGLEFVKNNPKTLLWIVVMVACYFFGNALIYWAIKQKNATAVSLIEISYPFFVVLFSWLLFRQNQITFGTTVGGGLIFAGVTFMYLFK
jgi:drug/metabolite transporter (DMT)-like permease